MSISCVQILISKYHFLIKGISDFFFLMVSRLGQRKYKMSLEYLVAPNRKYSKNEEMSEDTESDQMGFY